MKNSMTPEEQCQAVIDNAAGYDMQYRLFTIVNPTWNDRTPEYIGEPLNFSTCEYRRKPEPIIMYANIYKIGAPACHSSLADAKENKVEHFVRHVRLIEDPDWVEPEPAPTPMNPWRPIVKGEWPECKPDAQIVCSDENGRIWENLARNQGWNNSLAVKWKYAEDE